MVERAGRDGGRERGRVEGREVIRVYAWVYGKRNAHTELWCGCALCGCMLLVWMEATEKK